MKKVLTIAGSDSCGGAGIQADIKTMSSLGVYAMSVITAVTCQNTMGVFKVQEINKDIVESQIKCIFDDINVDAIKIGMVSNSEIIKTIHKMLLKYNAKNIVLDPVFISSSGYFLLKENAISEIKNLISICDLVTPNIPEAETLSNIKINNKNDMKKSAIEISKLGAKSILVKGGHRLNDATDILYTNNEFFEFASKKIITKNTHGTGCTLSSAIASYLAMNYSIKDSISKSKEYMNTVIRNSFSIGHGAGPLGHFIDIYKKANIKID